jgi:hypothetical protein
VNFRTRPGWVVFNDLVAKLCTLSGNHPERMHIARMIRELGRAIESKPLPKGELFPDRWRSAGRSLSADQIWPGAGAHNCVLDTTLEGADGIAAHAVVRSFSVRLLVT